MGEYFFLVRYEDRRALDGGEEGLDQAATILAMARHILKKNRWADTATLLASFPDHMGMRLPHIVTLQYKLSGSYIL